MAAASCAVDESEIVTQMVPGIEPPPTHMLFNEPIDEQVEDEPVVEPVSVDESTEVDDTHRIVLVLSQPIAAGTSLELLVGNAGQVFVARSLEAEVLLPSAIGSIDELASLPDGLVTVRDLSIGDQLSADDFGTVSDAAAELDEREQARLAAEEAEAQLDEARREFEEAAARAALEDAGDAGTEAPAALAERPDVVAWCEAWEVRPQRAWAADSSQLERDYWDALLTHDTTWPSVPELADESVARTSFLIAVRAFVIDLGLDKAGLKSHAGYSLVRAETGSDEYPAAYQFFAAEHCVPTAD